MLGMLLKVLGRDAIVGERRVTRKGQVFLDNLLRCVAHFTFRARAVEDAIYDVAHAATIVALAART